MTPDSGALSQAHTPQPADEDDMGDIPRRSMRGKHLGSL